VASITIMPSGARVPAEVGARLYQALIAAGAAVDAPCGGRGICGLCRVRAFGGLEPPGEPETTTLGPSMLAAGWRLACVARIAGDVEVLVADYHPAWSRPTARAGAVSGSVSPGPVAEHGIAVDLGTTSIVAQLVSLADGRRLATASALNPQYVHGADVLARISYAVDGGLSRLTSEAREGVGSVAARVLEAAGVAAPAVVRVVVVGNPTMLHLLAGADPAGLGTAPYTPAFLDALTVPPGALSALPAAEVRLLPSAASFLGSDVVAAGAAIGVIGDAPRSAAQLLVDLGTNGELLLASADGAVHGASAAAGPAFEAVGATWGMRAVDGAIDRVDVVDGDLIAHVIGGVTPAGICGSGLLDAVAAARRLGLLDGSGRLQADVPGQAGSRVRDTEAGRELVVAHVEGHDIVVSQLDVRNVQLAKGAVATAVRFLASRGGVSVGDPVAVAIAGAFGSGLRPETASGLGLLPEAWVPEMRSVGNAALEGATRALTDAAFASALPGLAAAILPVELAAEPGFQEAFLESLALEPW
jgi:uncharacterized 2Fe-2S/4Fe-4S cluster protein (DUF4445 family)